MSVRVVGWSDNGALALVDGVKVRIRRFPHRTTWTCQQHGELTALCPHAQQLANTPADPADRWPNRKARP